MKFSQWMTLMGIVVGLGVAKVAQQTSLWLSAYDLGHRQAALHELENDTLWLKTQVAALESPSHLVQVEKDRQLSLVARAELHTATPAARLAQASHLSSQDRLSD